MEQDSSVGMLNHQIADIDQQLNILLEKKRELTKMKNEQLPNAFEVMNEKKRKRSIFEDQSFKDLDTLLKENNSKKNNVVTAIKDSNQDEDLNLTSHTIKKIKQRNVYSPQVKKLVVDLHNKKFSNSDIQQSTGIPLSNIKLWNKEAAENKISSKRGRRVTYPDIEEYLKEWIKTQRASKNHLSVRRLLVEARNKAKNEKKDKVKFTWGWFISFMKRNSLKLRKPTTKILKPRSTLIKEKISQYKKKIKALVDTGIYDLDYVINADETCFSLEEITTKTICYDQEEVNDINEDAVPLSKAISHPTTKSAGKFKDYTTVMLAGSWTGKKLNAMVILPDKGVKMLKVNIPENVYVAHRPKGSYMDIEMMKKWVTYVLRPYAKGLPLNKRGLLMFDNFSGHLDSDVIKAIRELRFDLEPLPANTTGELQPMDISVNKPFKNFISIKWEEYAASLNNEDVTKSGYYKAPPRERKVTWTSFAWGKITADIISNGFNVHKNVTIEDSAIPENQLNQNSIQEAIGRLDLEENKENEKDSPDLEKMFAEKSDEDEEIREEDLTGIDPIRGAFLDYNIIHEDEAEHHVEQK